MSRIQQSFPANLCALCLLAWNKVLGLVALLSTYTKGVSYSALLSVTHQDKLSYLHVIKTIGGIKSLR